MALENVEGILVVFAAVDTAAAAADGLRAQVSFGLGLRGTSDAPALALASASASVQAQIQPYWQDREIEDVEERGMRQPVVH